MSHRSLLIALVVVAVSWAGTAQAQLRRAAIITQNEARRHGLNRAWLTQIEMDRTRDRVQHVVLYQPQPQVQPAAGDAAAGQPLRIGADNPMEAAAAGNQAPAAGNNPFNAGGQDQDAPAAANPFGNAPAADQPDADADPADAPQAPAGGAEAAPRKSPFSHPGEAGMLLVQTERGLLHALDAETGRTYWVQQVGDRMKPSERPAMNDDRVAVINGMMLYLLDRKSGKLVWSRKLPNVSVCGPTLSSQFVYVLAVDGKLTAFNVDDPNLSWHYSSFGRVEAPLLLTRRSMAWASDRGHVYLSDVDTPNLAGRFESGKAFTAELTYWPPLIYAPSQDGYLYALDDLRGTAIWRYSVGERLMQPATPLGDSVYIISEIGGMLALSADQGLERWFVPLVERFLAASPTRMYVFDAKQQLVVLDRATGAPITAMTLPGLDVMFSNRQNDRLYVGTSTGMIQCLHEIGLERPEVHIFPPVKMSEDRSGQGGKQPQP